jgi:hypothetical protein
LDHFAENGVVGLQRGECTSFEGVYVDGSINPDIFYDRDRRTLSYSFTFGEGIGAGVIDLSRRSNDDLDAKGLALVYGMADRADASMEIIGAGAAVGVAGGAAVAAAPLVVAGAQELAFGPSTGRVMYQFSRLPEALNAGRIIANSRLGTLFAEISSSLPKGVTDLGWILLSRYWASGASGTVQIFAGQKTPESVLWNTELPILFENLSVTGRFFR